MEALDILIPLEGALQKFTNVMKGFQYRFFVINPNSGFLEYYLSEDTYKQKLKPRNAIFLGDCIISPSEEDSCTFIINSSNGEIFKLRALDARERQIWVNRLRAVSEHFIDKFDQQSSNMVTPVSKGPNRLPTTTSADFLSNVFNFENITKNLISCKTSNDIMQSSHSVPSTTVASSQPSHMAIMAPKPDSENQLTAVHEVLRITQRHYEDIKDIIEGLCPRSHSYGQPSFQDSQPRTSATSTGTKPPYILSHSSLGSLDPDLLLLKASTFATINSLKSCLDILEQSVGAGYYNNFLLPAPQLSTPLQSSVNSCTSVSHSQHSKLLVDPQELVD